MSTPKQALAELLAEVKLAEKKHAAAQERLEPLKANIKRALTAGDRPAAEKLALAYEQQKDEVARAEQQVAAARAAFESGKKTIAGVEANLKTAKQANALADPLKKMLGSMDVAAGADDMLRKLAEDAAVSEAKLEMLIEDADQKGAPPPVPSSPEDLLKEFEKDA